MNTPESTLFNAVPVVSELNRVAGFDPLRFLKKTANGHELELRYKKALVPAEISRRTHAADAAAHHGSAGNHRGEGILRQG